MTPPKILLLVGDFVEDYEAMVPLQTCLAVGMQVDVVCPNKKPGDFVLTAVHDFEGQQTYSEKPGHRFAITADFEQAVSSSGAYDALILPGGRAPEYLRNDADVVSLVRKFLDDDDKVVVSICHGAQMLAAAALEAGKTPARITAYPACGVECKLAGFEFVEAAADGVVVDEERKIVSGPAWPSHPSVMREMFRLLGTTVSHGGKKA
jgi:protease I